MEPLVIGSAEHRDLMCKMFMDTFTPFEPEKLEWPDLDDATLSRLRALPVWDEAVKTEAETAMKVTELGKVQTDPKLKEAISLQGYEEQRHADILKIMTSRYKLEVHSKPNLTPPPDPEWAFLRVGYGECFDSFFAFGLFAVARDSGFFPPSLVKLFEPVMQEEGRHILFHINWVAYKHANYALTQRPSYIFRRALAIYLQVAGRIKTALQIAGGAKEASDQDNFTMNAHESFGDFSLTEFLRICLAENERRLAPYDKRLLRPTLVPGIARTMLKVAPGGKVPAAA
jgi:hypothetical protein